VTAKPRLSCGGIFTPDPDVPADHNGRRTCVCHLTGQPGDAHHTLPPTPDFADARQLAAGEDGGER
jgi:hypothetical protein